MTSTSHDDRVRYARQRILPGIGEEGQKKFSRSRVLIVGVGGLGCPCALYLAAAGVGHITLVDGDRVELSNLHRQILFETADVGRPKVEAARDALRDINPTVSIDTVAAALDASNAKKLIAAHDSVADGCDDIATRFLVADTCMKKKKTLVSAAVHQWEGHLSTFKAHLGAPHPCYRCLYPTPPPQDAMPACSEAGILGAVAGALGAWQAAEIVKELLGVGESLSGTLLRFDMLTAQIHRTTLTRDPKCECGR